MVNDTSGKLAEFMALQHLRLKGYALVACNYKTGRGTGAGEVDIIVKNQTSLVFIEVKKRIIQVSKRDVKRNKISE